MVQEVLVSDSTYNIHRGKIAAWKALTKYLTDGQATSDEIYVPDLSPDDQRLDDLVMTSYSAIREAWVATYQHWKFPMLFIVVQFDNKQFYSQVHKYVLCDSDTSQLRLF